ncbi:MAG: hypothetical protein AAGI69_10240 [Cyanobacteria bacterium P01_H01_bin.21]
MSKDKIFIAVFYGGKKQDWAPRVDSTAFFDGFVISREPLEPFVG